MKDAIAARGEGAALVFISPVYPTLSHPGQPALGAERAIELARAAGVPAIALGGMTKDRFAPLEQGGFHGWAGIDAWDKASD
jgi:thiamine-phosphate pyrophosphorylase